MSSYFGKKKNKKPMGNKEFNSSFNGYGRIEYCIATHGNTQGPKTGWSDVTMSTVYTIL